ncbi:MAG: VanW family protein [Clostridia bacterium]|nr:VanW family protein [Clostridia bacterium]
MKKSLVKTLKIFTALVFIASALFLCCGFTGRLPRGVTVNGTDVGGMTINAAKSALRKGVEEDLKQKRLRICADERVYEYSYPEIDFKDGFTDTLLAIKKSGEYTAPVHYFLNGAEEIVTNICADFSRPVVEPYAVFNTAGEAFTYFQGSDGVECDKAKLLDDISSSLNGDFQDVRICTRDITRTESVDDVKARTRRLYSFTTYFDADNTDRSSNIRLAAQKINGTVIEGGGVFSFNQTVGARTQENGFKSAKIIENGKFVLGVGGGVCQVSTTLYNAALLSGLGIVEYHPHSLQVSYVAPSRDAMVSGNYFDLKFKNNRKTPIYIRVNCTLNSVCCTVYGEEDGYSYSFSSKVTASLPRPEPVVVQGDEDKIVSYGREGTESEGYLIRQRDGEEISELIRKDKYPAVADVIQQAQQPADTQEMQPSDGE